MCYFQLLGLRQHYHTPEFEGKRHFNILNVCVSTRAVVLNFAHVAPRSFGGVMVTYRPYDMHISRRSSSVLSCPNQGRFRHVLLAIHVTLHISLDYVTSRFSQNVCFWSELL